MFFSRNNKDRFQNDLKSILSSKDTTVIFEKQNNNIVVSCTNDTNTASIFIDARMSSNTNLYKLNNLSGNILSPLVFDFDRICIPSKYIYFFGRNDNCMGEFLIRNLSANLLVKTKINFQVNAIYDWNSDIHKQLVRIYSWSLKNNFPKDLNGADFSTESLYINCFIKTKQFISRRLNSDANDIRSLHKNTEDEYMNLLLSSRDELINTCYGKL